MPDLRALVIGAGLAGAAVADALARRGWEVQVLDSASRPAQGASGLPAGLMAPHLSADDGLLSQLTRHGLRATRATLERLTASGHLQAGADWQAEGALEHRVRHKAWPSMGPPGPQASRLAQARELLAAGLSPEAPALWHPEAGWVKPAALVRAWLATPGVIFRGGLEIRRIEWAANQWRALGEDDTPIAQAPVVVLAAALASAALAPVPLRVQPVRGQVTWGLRTPGDRLPPFPVNGHGHLLPAIPQLQGLIWVTGSTYGHGEADPWPRAEDQQANWQRLQALLPQAATTLAPLFDQGRAQAWSGVRCASTDRRPLVGTLAPGLWISTALGSRGLTLAALCAEVLAARLCGTPLPLPAGLAQALDPGRQSGESRPR